MLPSRDQLVQIVDAALADAARRAQRPDGTSWLACRPGCTPCCHGVFRISALDAIRLRAAFEQLETKDATRAQVVLARAIELADELRPAFPGDAVSGVLNPEEDGSWDLFADLPEADAACPVLDPATGTCELYDARPLTCRIFGPPVRQEEGFGVCELCYVGASEEEIVRGEMYLSHEGLEEELNRTLPAEETIIAWALLRGREAEGKTLCCSLNENR